MRELLENQYDEGWIGNESEKFCNLFKQSVTCCQTGYALPSECDCDTIEKVLRAYADGRCTIPMTHEEREYCIDDANRCGEGFYNREELLKLSDKELAQATIHAWQMYVRSQGL